jgi:uncharacterized membrane protein YjfL (UPF0719 family)
MNTETFYYSLLEIGVSIFLGVTILYLSYRIIDKLVRERLKISSNNVSFALFVSSILFSVAYLISGIKSPILNSIKLLLDNPQYEGSIVLDGIKYSLLFFIIIIITIALVILISILMFTYMTNKINEFDEIRKNNIAVGIITATLVISISIIIKESIYLLLESFVPYPEIPKIF